MTGRDPTTPAFTRDQVQPDPRESWGLGVVLVLSAAAICFAAGWWVRKYS